jgi:hypothetical protein
MEGRRKSEQGLATGQQEECSSDDDGKEVEVFPTRFMAKKKVVFAFIAEENVEVIV